MKESTLSASQENSIAIGASAADPAETINPIVKDAPELDNYIIPNPALPSLIRTWARRKKRENKTLKTYYIVLDRGTLSLYKDSLEVPPYGHSPKGHLFLADCRASKSTEPGEDCLIVLSRSPSNISHSTSSQLGLQSDEIRKASSDSMTPRGGTESITSNDTSRHSLCDGSKPLLLLFVDQKSRDKWLEMFRQHVSWAVAHSEDDRTELSKPKSRLSWIPSPFGRKSR